MLGECLVFGALGKTAIDAAEIEKNKSIHFKLTKQEQQEILQDDGRRFVHFTSKESAEKIMESGFLIPTKGVLANHFTRTIDNEGKKRNAEMVYMFDSAKFGVDDYIRNLPKSRSPFNGCYEYYAVSMKPDEYEINNFTSRVQDGAITYNGRLDIDGTDTKLVKYVLGLDEQGEYNFTEVPMDYEYEPPQELLDKLDKDRMGNLRYNFTTYMSELKKAKISTKTFKAKKEQYKEQIRKKKEFAKANRQFKEEEKDKSYIFEKDGRKIVVKNVEYEEIGGKKLQKLAIIENSDKTKGKYLKDAAKFCYMDEMDLSTLDSRVASEYFFNNLDRINEQEIKHPEYIGLPTENLETGEVFNEYDTTFDTTFKAYMDRRGQTKAKLDKEYYEYTKGRKWTHKIKEMFSKVFGRKKDVKLLEEKTSQEMYEPENREKLAKLGCSSVEVTNKDDKEANMFSMLRENTNSLEEVNNYYNNENLEMRNQEERIVEER